VGGHSPIFLNVLVVVVVLDFLIRKADAIDDAYLPEMKSRTRTTTKDEDDWEGRGRLGRRTLIDNLDGGAQIDVVEEDFRHFTGHPDTSMRGWITGQIAFVHAHASGDAHKKRHWGALEN
jgi:hypothetical protein